MKRLIIIPVLFFSILFFSCNKSNPANSGENNSDHPPNTPGGIAFKNNTKILSGNETSRILSVTDSSISFSSSDNTINNIKTGDVIVAGVSNKTPGGLLRKVTRVANSGANSSARVFFTQMASLDELIKSGKIFFRTNLLSVNQPLNQYLFDADNDTSTLGNQVSLKGTINESCNLSGYFVFNGTSSISTELSYDFTGNEELNLAGDINTNLNVVYNIIRSPLEPILLYSDPPIVITPVFNLYVSLSGLAKGKFTSNATDNFESTVTATYDRGWNFKSGLADTFFFKGASINFSSDIKLKIESSIKLIVYEVPGPIISLSPYLQLSSNLSESPKWILYDGDDASAQTSSAWLSNLVPGTTWSFSSHRNELSHAN